MAAKKEEKEAPEELAAPKKSKKKIIILIVILMLLAGAGAGGSFWFFNLRDPAPTASYQGGESGQVQPDQGSSTTPPTPADMPRPSVNILPLPTVTVNLSDAAGDRYLKLGMEVEMSTPQAVQELQQQQARVRDAMIILLSSKTYSELSSPEGKMQLKNDIAGRLNQILGTPRVVRIYFTEFVVS